MRRPLSTVLLASLCGCLWRGYGTIMTVHLDVLTQTAAKLSSIVESGRGPTAEGMAEYVYPSKRGREFLRQFRSFSSRPSYEQFSTFLDRYDDLVRQIDAARTLNRLGEADVRQQLAADRAALDATAAEIRASLERGA
jgi:hypothetical protein